jgi:hypothetical protein
MIILLHPPLLNHREEHFSRRLIQLRTRKSADIQLRFALAGLRLPESRDLHIIN